MSSRLPCCKRSLPACRRSWRPPPSVRPRSNKRPSSWKQSVSSRASNSKSCACARRCWPKRKSSKSKAVWSWRRHANNWWRREAQLSIARQRQEELRQEAAAANNAAAASSTGERDQNQEVARLRKALESGARRERAIGRPAQGMRRPPATRKSSRSCARSATACDAS